MLTVFAAHAIDDVVTGARVKPNEAAAGAANIAAVAAEIKQWKKDNAKAMFLISSTMEYSQLECLITCATAKEMWDKLIAIHDRTSASNKLFLLQKFHDYRMNTSDSVISHVAKIQNLARQLRDVGEPMSDVAIVAKILGSLPSKYSALITALDSVNPEMQTIQALQERLIKEETRLSNEDDMSALATTSNKKKQENPGKQRPETKKKVVECFYCKKKGHFARNCRKKKRDKQDSSETSNCAFVIESSGHERAQAVPRGNRQSRFSGREVTDRDNKSHSAVEKRILKTGIEDVWLTDSGASKHITFR